MPEARGTLRPRGLQAFSDIVRNHGANEKSSFHRRGLIEISRFTRGFTPSTLPVSQTFTRLHSQALAGALQLVNRSRLLLPITFCSRMHNTQKPRDLRSSGRGRTSEPSLTSWRFPKRMGSVLLSLFSPHDSVSSDAGPL